MNFVPTLRQSLPVAAIAASLLATIGIPRAAADAQLLIEASTGKVLFAENAGYPWYPASVTKLMTAYVTLQAVKQRRLSLNSLLTVSARAAAQQPSKMGFKPGTQVTVDNALKMLMVKSANDVAVVLAEGVSESVEQFADEMNQTSRRLGMTQSSWVNPNGLPADDQISSARDLGILARALIKDFPEYDYYWHLPGIKFGKKVMRNYNTLLGRYTGADGMKTGFICAAGFNLVASATRNNRRLIAVVLGAPSSPVRAVKAAMLLERGFNSNPLSWLTPAMGTVNTMPAINAAPPDLRDEMCGPHRRRPAAEEVDDENDTNTPDTSSPVGFMLSSVHPAHAKPSSLLGPVGPILPVAVFTGPGKSSPPDPQLARAKNTKPDRIATAPAGSALPTPAAATSSVFPPPPAPAGSPAPAMSFVSPARAETPPLTAMPAAAPPLTMVPMPRPRPKKRAATQ